MAALLVCGVLCALKRRALLAQNRYLDVEKTGAAPIAEEPRLGDAAAVEDSGTSLALDPVQTSETVEASELSDLTIPISNRTPSILKRSSAASPRASQIGLERTASERKVRFALPEDLSWSSDSDRVSKDGGDTGNHDCTDDEPEKNPSKALATDDMEAWVTWIMNPLFEAGQALKSSEADVESSPSQDSSAVDSVSPLLPDFVNDSDSRRSSTLSNNCDARLLHHAQAILGIKDRQEEAFLEAGDLHQQSQYSIPEEDDIFPHQKSHKNAFRTIDDTTYHDVLDEQGLDLMEI